MGPDKKKNHHEANNEYMQTHYTLADSIPSGDFNPIWCWKKTTKTILSN